MGLLLENTTSLTATIISEILAGLPEEPVISNLPSIVFQEVEIFGWVPVKIN